ncbi:MAG: DUF1330 domain-containing protein [Erythrobacter sp.]
MMTATLLMAFQGIPAGAAPPPPQSTCDKPVYMVVEGRTLDLKRMMAYGKAIAESDIYQKLGGYYVTMPRPLEVFEGDVEPNYVNLTVRFPCIENARAFWNSKAYQETILPIRQNPAPAGDYTVTIYGEAPLREDMVGKVTAPVFTEDFSDPDVPQVKMPVVGPKAETANEEK